MTEITEIATWFSISGWTRAHEIESAPHAHPKWTRCGRLVKTMLVQASDTTPRCQACLKVTDR